MLNKRAVGQLLPDRRHVKAIQKVAPYFSRAVNRPPEVRPKNLTIGGRFSYGKI